MKAIVKKAFCAVMIAAIVSGVSGQATWTWRNPPTNGNTLYGAAWDGVQLVVVGENGMIATSFDDTTWIVRNSGIFYELHSVVWAKQWFIAVGQRGTVLRSPDGITWTAMYSGTTNNLRSVSWDGKKAIAIGDNGTILISSDGASWKSSISGTDLRLNSLAWNDSLFVAVGEEGTIVTSSDLLSWQSTKVVSGGLYSVTWADSQFIAVGDGNMSYNPYVTSKDGRNWTVASPWSGNPVYSILWTGSALIATGCEILTKEPNSNWKQTYSLSNNKTAYFAFNKGKQIIAVGSRGTILKSADGVSWTVLKTVTADALRSVTWTGKKFVAVGDSGTIVTSPSGIAWSRQKSPTAQALRNVVWTGTQLMAVGDNHTVIASADGVSWDSLPGQNLWGSVYSVIWTGSQYVAGVGGRIAVSPDGGAWTVSPSFSLYGYAIMALAWNGKSYTCVDRQGDFFTSSDAVEWVEKGHYLGPGSLNAATVLCIGGRMSAFGNNFMATSQDGTEWVGPTAVIDILRSTPVVSAVWTGGEFIVAGKQSIFSSFDGTALTERYSDTSLSMNAIAFDGKQFVSVGDFGYILTSPYIATGLIAGADTQGARAKSAFSFDFTGRSLGIIPAPWYRGHAIAVDVCTAAGRKAASAVYRDGTRRIAIPLKGYALGVYFCIVRADGEQAIRPFTIIK